MKNCPTCHSTYPGHFSACPHDGVALVEAEDWSSGMVIRGKYRILNKIAQGGMGGVYKAHHVIFDELRALKVMNSALLGDSAFVRRFKQEAVIARKLQHANAVRVDDIDEAEDGRPFIVMEYIEGESLKRVIQKRGRLPVERACSIAKQVAAALDAAHRMGMVHRDIKPANIVLLHTPAGEQAKVLDFGIAKLKEAHARDSGGLTLTGTGMVIGTPQYMSPEQAAGKRGDQLDGRSDIYSLGVVMYQMLTGELPFKADTTIELILAQINSPPRPIIEVHPELRIPSSVAQLVMQCLEKRPEMRPPTGENLITRMTAVGDIAWEWETAPTRFTTIASPGTISRATRQITRQRTGPVIAAAAHQPGRPGAVTPSKQEQALPLNEQVDLVPSFAPEPPLAGAQGRRRHWLLFPVAAVLVIAAGLAARQFEIRRHVAKLDSITSNLSHQAPNRSPAQRLNSPSSSSPALAGNGSGPGPSASSPGLATPAAAESKQSSGDQISGTASNAASMRNQTDSRAEKLAGRTRLQRIKQDRETMASLRSAGGAERFAPGQVEITPLSDLAVATAPEAAVFVDGKEVGKADSTGQITVDNLKPGSHALRVELAGYPEIDYSVQSAPGETSFVSAKWTSKVPRSAVTASENTGASSVVAFPATFAVIHEHRIGSDKGALVIQNNSIQYRADDGKDSFISPLNGVNCKETRKDELSLRLADGRTYTFRSTSIAAILSAIQQALSKP